MRAAPPIRAASGPRSAPTSADGALDRRAPRRERRAEPRQDRRPEPRRPEAPRPEVPGLRPPAGPRALEPRPAGAEVVHPRFSARRIAVRRTEGRKRLRRVLWLAGMAALVAVAVGATRTPLLDVDHVQVAGADEALQQQVEAVLAEAGLHRGDPLLDVDLAAAVVALRSLPAVVDADVVRRWPGTIAVELTERTPVAAVTTAAGAALVGADGVVIRVDPATATAAEGLVTILLPAEETAGLEPGDDLTEPDLLTVAAALPEALRPLVAAVVPGTGDASVELQLVDGAAVRLGPTDQLGAKLVAAATVLTQVDTTCLATVDVRVPSVPAVTRDPGC